MRCQWLYLIGKKDAKRREEHPRSLWRGSGNVGCSSNLHKISFFVRVDLLDRISSTVCLLAKEQPCLTWSMLFFLSRRRLRHLQKVIRRTCSDTFVVPVTRAARWQPTVRPFLRNRCAIFPNIFIIFDGGNF